MKQFFFLSALSVAMSLFATPAKGASHDVDIKKPDGTILKGTYFAAGKSGPSALLFHQSNRTRKSWDDVARQLAAAGINVLTVDTDPNKTRKKRWSCSTSPHQTQAGNSCITLPHTKRPGCGMNRSTSGKCRRKAATEPTCSNPIPSCPASSWIGL